MQGCYVHRVWEDSVKTDLYPFPRASRAVMMLASMVYGMPHLDWSQPTDHAELFSGCMSVTKGEMQALSLPLGKRGKSGVRVDPHKIAYM